MEPIPLPNLALAFLPVVVVLIVLICWQIPTGRTQLAILRMLVQLIAVGYVLTYIFESPFAPPVLAILLVMLSAATWIALGPVEELRLELFAITFLSIGVGGLLTLVLVTQGVLQCEPWFAPRQVIPLGGMILANAMNTVSIAAERFLAERATGLDVRDCRFQALKTALIPLTNSLLAVGLVSFPGMMTGQILAGESPLVAARYQIMVMCMVFGSGGMSAALFLCLLSRQIREIGET